MSLVDNSLWGMREALRTSAGGAFVLGAGITTGAGISLLIVERGLDAWHQLFTAPFVLFARAMCEAWGAVLLLPLYGMLFVGLIWLEWNRLRCFCIAAIATSSTLVFALEGMGLWDTEAALQWMAAEAILGALLARSVLAGRSGRIRAGHRPGASTARP